ncbi:molybdopterin-dependent oxidoreductase [Salmonella enterica]|nr:molybdopterin-dependent oxidoreductase [Salmonella enterica]
MKITNPEALMAASLSRRSLVKTSAIGSLALASSAFTLPFSRIAHAAADLASGNVAEKAVWSSCTVNCGSRCLLRLHVKDDTVYWVESDTTGNDEYGNHQVRACLRGRSIRRRMNHPDRLKYPMKRVGKRGEGKFERISWDEALDTIGDNLKRILKDYGNEAVHVLYGTGVDGGNITNSNVPYRLMNACGGYLSRYGSYSTAQISAAMSYMFGGNDGNSPDDIANTKLVVMFGNNPAETRMSGGGVTYYVEQARERSNARMIVIDPRYNDTAAGREDEWLPIRPGTDGALAAAIAWVLITEDLIDKPFLDKYCIGYDETTLHAKTKARNPEMPDYEEMKQTGIFKKKCPEEHYVAFRAFREDPAANPLKTPSGKIEIYSERLATLANTWELKKDEIIHPLPAYTPGFDGWDDPLRQRYPLQLTGFHYKARTHSSYGNIDILQQACPQEIWINPIDAQARGIQHGDTVRVFNQNGEMLIPAKVTPRILPGVTAIGQGAWLNADMFGDKVDRGGSINILTSHRPSPLAKGNPSHSNLVQVEKA